MFTICNTHCFYYKHPQLSAVYQYTRECLAISMRVNMFIRPNSFRKWLVLLEITLIYIYYVISVTAYPTIEGKGEVSQIIWSWK